MGVLVLAILGAGVVLYYGAGQDDVALSPLARVTIGKATQSPARRPDSRTAQQGMDKGAKGKTPPSPAKVKPLSLDPGARLLETPAWLKNSIATAPSDGRPMIAVVIDDVGLDRPRSLRAMALPAPVTIAIMSYADDARDQAATAHRAGHELLVHLPMEPGDEDENPGPNALLSDLSAKEFERRLEWNLTQFAGYVGVNNHMGSKLTSNPAALAPVMAALKRRGLLFLDSRTSGATQGLAVARSFGVPAVERNVFIDHDNSPIAVRTALIHIEDLAQKNGFAIAIGHPRDSTLDALEEWLPELKKRGFAVVPLTAIVRHLAAEG